MESLPSNVFALVAVVFLLGLKHGFDADHLAAIDGLTRFNSGMRPRVSRWSGLLFSAGHGLVVTVVAVVVATVASNWQVPGWLESVGAWLSIGFLVAIGGANLMAVLRTPRDQIVRIAGLRTRAFGRLTQVSHPVIIAAVGAAFAISFDTISQAVLFSLAGSNVAGWVFAAALGLIFTAGMMATDAINGLWVSGLVARADRRAAVASRVLSATIGALALAIASLGAARQLHPGLDAQLELWGPALGVGVVVFVALAFATGLRLAARAGAA